MKMTTSSSRVLPNFCENLPRRRETRIVPNYYLTIWQKALSSVTRDLIHPVDKWQYPCNVHLRFPFLLPSLGSPTRTRMKSFANAKPLHKIYVICPADFFPSLEPGAPLPPSSFSPGRRRESVIFVDLIPGEVRARYLLHCNIEISGWRISGSACISLYAPFAGVCARATTRLIRHSVW